ncbi:lipocalin-like domain-containing protein [Aequorivita xiaoshiensis]|uniref:Lipocalin-like domain-containing protein n=1 Tax=Aequorivita xiaoshiensis TaxID=2874476 RepID=A0A9X1R316_9FLAO|nr:lipocalin-like domain-containing protein [Aequorivita xiaoshiensis]MCG2430982.1 lipocalin-like domain-containing protein [Aequorivita xiaoshiensis]
MNKIKYIVVAAVLWSSISCQNERYNNPSITGLWKLEGMKVRDTTTNTWSPYRGGMDGYLLYGNNNHVALHLYDNGYENVDIEFPNFTDSISLEALKHITKSYYYMGNYKVSEADSIVSHYKLSHSNPSEFGLTAQRRFYFVGDTLIMQPVERKNSRLKLKWLKVK